MLKENILQAAVKLARNCGYQRLTRFNIAGQVGCCEATINYHYGSMIHLKSAVIAYAIAHEILSIVVEALAARHPDASNLSDTLRRKAAREMSGIDRL